MEDWEKRERKRETYRRQREFTTKRAIELEKKREFHNKYMEDHRKSLEDKEIDCTFVCGKKSKIKSDLCEVCDEKYKIYMENRYQNKTFLYKEV